jgi:hypothetical protein
MIEPMLVTMTPEAYAAVHSALKESDCDSVRSTDATSRAGSHSSVRSQSESRSTSNPRFHASYSLGVSQ